MTCRWTEGRGYPSRDLFTARNRFHLVEFNLPNQIQWHNTSQTQIRNHSLRNAFRVTTVQRSAGRLENFEVCLNNYNVPRRFREYCNAAVEDLSYLLHWESIQIMNISPALVCPYQERCPPWLDPVSSRPKGRTRDLGKSFSRHWPTPILSILAMICQ